MTKLAIVTGAGQGIGESVAFRLAQDGFAIGVADINSVTGEEVAHALVEAGYEAKFYQVDVAHRDEVFQLVDQAVSDLGELAVYVNNAGIAVIDAFVDADPVDVERILDVNLKGTYWGIQAAATRFKQQGHGGRIVNASALQSAYSASKFGIRGLTQSAAKELAADQITVNAYNPGVVRTPLRDAIDERTAEIKRVTVPEQQANVLTEIALGREATPADVAEVVAWFASPTAAYITGQSIMVDGGMEFL
jgi:meso-butanediol dehydrogenase/(S,S)-butanediol dehydrogenase/diacetyl reductase